ncbi:Kef-type potassium/proton antiporter, CPA2 family [Longilinea arvoryzae]|uniref:Kef-type potassium/proton antiporter, CPA2 family n=1 Tax=Longilinea arvoryzae TaxID=360412 RepID=A0A0K8MXH8_9CHLR|nr:cation:proton antiporter [Longilinea arvoryzae]GAP15968.1 Kef-type potassium/proton antiporter, CPA2 family [Longilinea arvoryzae]
MHDLPLLLNITLGLVAAFFGGVLARRIGLPTIVGYLLAGIVIGPFTPGLTGDVETIQQLAELGIIFLMFGVGLHFSFKDLFRVRDIAIPGALLQTLLATLAGATLSHFAWGWSIPASLVLGLSISVASTVVLTRGLMDHNLLNTSHGQAAVGWLVMEDILSVLILVLMPALAGGAGGFDGLGLLFTLLKAAAFGLIMFFVGARAVPWLLDRIAHTRSRELFILAILAITLGVAVGAAGLFGVSLALGAFVAGAIVSQSRLSLQVGADILPFREAFSVLFFVSVGMLVNPIFLWTNLGQVLGLTLLVVFGKAVLTLLLGLAIPRRARTFLVVAVGLSQIGEFSFILGQGGLSLGLLNNEQYSLILAAALISITVNPLMYRLLPALESGLQRLPWVWNRLDRHHALPPVDVKSLNHHVVIVGYGRIGRHLVDVLSSLEVPLLVIEADPDRIQELNARQIACLYGDAANSEVITHAGLNKARALVSTAPEEATAAMVVAAARDINPALPIVARAASLEGVDHLTKLGANHIVHPELEGGLEMVLHTLLQLGYPLRKVYDYVESVRRDRYNVDLNSPDEYRSLRGLIRAADNVEIYWLDLAEGSPLVGQSLRQADLRARTGASVVAILREDQLISNPKSHSLFQAGDRIGVIGEPDQIELVGRILGSG